MKKYITLSLIIVLCFNVFAQVDPLKVETYTLNNGLTVYLNVDKNLPMVHGMVVVKGGSKRDPKDATGIAHYFEHIMFKGTDEIGTVDYDSERLYLDSIAALYDQLAATINEDARLKIQTEINRISIKAAEYAIPNEVDKILSRMGGEAINAGTGYEFISYYNSFPANQIEKWLEVYSHRFENPVFRLFQSELETVYEEKNLYADNPMDVLFEQVMKEFFKTSPYGQQTILGSTEHLKNPSLTKMAGYFDKYYVANNMALILAGDFDPDMVKPVIEEKFGKWRKGEEPSELNLAEPPFDGREQVTRRLTPIKIGVLGYRSIPKNHPDEIKLQVCNHLLNNNASTGLLDKLREDNDILYAGTIELFFTEVGGNAIFYVPKIIGQSLNAAEKKILAQIDKLKSGDFSDELFNGIKTEMKKNNERMLEDMRWRTYAIADVFVYDDTWENLLKTSREIDAITKEEVVQVANKYFSENYLAFHSKMGLRKKDKIEKPPFKPVPSSNGEMMSEYAKNIEAMPTVEMKPRFIDFEKDVVSVNIAEGIKGYVTNNPVNEIFSIKLVYGKGDYADPMVNQAASAFEFARPKDVSLEEFRKKLQLLGCDFYAYNDLSSLTINITGLEDNLEKTLKLINQLLQEITVDEHQLKKLVE
ncbi:MAG: insulinase family protein, partial [Bacteroidota bacterium]